MGRKHPSRSKSRPQRPKTADEQIAAARRVIENGPPRESLTGLGADKLPRTGSKVYGKRCRPPGAARVSAMVDELRHKPSHTGKVAAIDPNPGRTTFVRSRKGGVSTAYVKPPTPRDECPGCGSTGTHESGCAYLPNPDRDALAQSAAREGHSAARTPRWNGVGWEYPHEAA